MSEISVEENPKSDEKILLAWARSLMRKFFRNVPKSDEKIM